MREAFHKVDFVVDVDDTFHQPSERLRFSINQENLEFYGVDEQAVYDTIAAIIGGVKVGYSQRGHGTKPIEIDVKLPKRAEWMGERILSTPLPAGGTRAAGRQRRTRRCRHREARARLVQPLPPRRPLRRDGRRRKSPDASRRRSTGCSPSRTRSSKLDWGDAGPPADPLSRPAARRVRSHRCCGTANGK